MIEDWKKLIENMNGGVKSLRGLAQRFEQPHGIHAHAEVLVGIGTQHHQVRRLRMVLAALVQEHQRFAIALRTKAADGSIAEDRRLQFGDAALFEPGLGGGDRGIARQSRQSLYPTNLIENFNKHLKRTTHHKEQFPTEDSLDRFLVSQFNVYNEKSLKRIHRGFKGLQDTLEASFI